MKVKKKKFVSVIWGYHEHMYSFASEENYHIHVLKIAKELGFETHVIVLNRKSIINDPNFDKDINVIEYKNIFNFLYRIIKFSLQNSVFYVNSLEWQSFIVPFLARRTIFMAHTQPERKSKLKQKIQNFVYIFFKAIRLNNETEKEFLIKQKINPKKLFTIPLVVSQDVFSLKNDDTNTRKDIIFFGNVTKIKNLSTILMALSEVRKKNNDIKLNIIGNIWDSNFKVKINELGLESSVIIHDFLPQDENLNNLLNQTLISVNSSLSEGQCVAVYDTALSGNVLCLTKIMSFTGVFKDKALFHDIYDYKKLSENIIYYLDNPDIIKKYREECIEMIKSDYSKKTIEEKLKELIRKI